MFTKHTLREKKQLASIIRNQQKQDQLIYSYESYNREKAYRRGVEEATRNAQLISLQIETPDQIKSKEIIELMIISHDGVYEEHKMSRLEARIFISRKFPNNWVNLPWYEVELDIDDQGILNKLKEGGYYYHFDSGVIQEALENICIKPKNTKYSRICGSVIICKHL